MGRDTMPVHPQPELAHGQREQRTVGRLWPPLHSQPGQDHQGLAGSGRHSMQNLTGTGTVLTSYAIDIS
jgi:hypothetical protein